MPGVSIVIVAAGSGRRMGRGDKLFLDVGGLPLIGHTWQRFDQLPETGEIIIVTRGDTRPLFEDLAKRIGAKKPWRLVAGGADPVPDRVLPSRATAAESELVAIQDGAAAKVA